MPSSATGSGRICHMTHISARPDDSQRGSIAIQFVLDALQGPLARGVDVSPMLVAAAIPQERLVTPRARVSPAQFATLWRQLADHMDDEFFGLDNHPMRRGSFRLMCHAALGSRTLEQALKRAIYFLRLVLDDTSASLELADGVAVLRLHDRRENVPLFAHGTYLMLVLGLVCWLVDRRIPLLEARLAQPAPEHGAEYRVLFGDSTRFEAEATELRFDADLLSLPVTRRPEELGDFLAEAPANFLVRYRNPHSFAARIRRLLRDCDPLEWPDFESVACAFGMTVSTLRRRLDDEGHSFQHIKDAVRRDMAIELLVEDGPSMVEIAHRLGFAEASAFHRAFRKWTGARPGSYRAQASNA